MFLKKIVSFVLISLLSFPVMSGVGISQNPALFAEVLQENLETTINETELYARSAVLMDASSGRVLYEKNGQEQMPMASTTKIMTCILALENGNMEAVMDVSSYAASMPRVHLGVREGEHYLLKDLLYSLMLESHNDSAVVIAEHIGGSVEGFADMMNQKARDIGCFDTYFITPNGLDASAAIEENGTIQVRAHSTTAQDLARMMSYCILQSPKKDEFLKITREAGYCFSNVVKQDDGEWARGERIFSCTNHNAFLGMMDGALSGKTGFTGNAGYCYVGALEDADRIFAVALLACGWPNNKGYKWKDTRKLMEYGIKNFSFHEFAEVPIDRSLLKDIPVENGQTKRIGESAFVPIYIEETDSDSGAGVGTSTDSGLSGLLLKDNECIELKYQITEELTAPVEKGEIVGNVRYVVDNTTWKTYQLKTAEMIAVIDFRWCLEKILNSFLAFG